MQGFVPHTIPTGRPRRRVTGSAFRPGGFALSVAPAFRALLIPRPRSGGASATSARK